MIIFIFWFTEEKMNVPVFIDIGLEEQAEELRAYFKGTWVHIGTTRPGTTCTSVTGSGLF